MELSVFIAMFDCAATVVPLEIPQGAGTPRKETTVAVYRPLDADKWGGVEQMNAQPDALNRIAEYLVIALPELTEGGHVLSRDEALRRLDPYTIKQIVQWILMRSDYGVSIVERFQRMTNRALAGVIESINESIERSPYIPVQHRRAELPRVHINETISPYYCGGLDLNNADSMQKLVAGVRGHYAELIKQWK